MHLTFTSDPTLHDGVVEREFTLDDIPGILWLPEEVSTPRPLILLGNPGDLGRMYPRLAARARQCVIDGYAAATLELPGSGTRPRQAALEEARTELRGAVMAGEKVTADVTDRLVLPIVEQAVPELRALIDALLAVPGVRGPVGYSGGVLSIGVRLAVVEPRIVAVGLFAGSWIPQSITEEARRITIPVHVLLQWDDEGNDRQQALDLFDAIGSHHKTLQANMGGHTGVPGHAGEDAARFFDRHLQGPAV
ncbi:alpha/beta hydrolase [Tessaracoccus sp. HDW20]|uniref:alpha/beta hydrolase n=1 Tax=Tessaracoccus coleopterorum TaxID=2714950 RepID=UPI0018D371CC|nr:alpha/beta hydrolase [Tessaracoccus coleopterorum]NHB86099.1 alpha/beta hydrolase [Tessaracoccus coleopterorum]